MTNAENEKHDDTCRDKYCYKSRAKELKELNKQLEYQQCRIFNLTKINNELKQGIGLQNWCNDFLKTLDVNLRNAIKENKLGDFINELQNELGSLPNKKLDMIEEKTKNIPTIQEIIKSTKIYMKPC